MFNFSSACRQDERRRRGGAAGLPLQGHPGHLPGRARGARGHGAGAQEPRHHARGEAAAAAARARLPRRRRRALPPPAALRRHAHPPAAQGHAHLQETSPVRAALRHCLT